MLTVAEQLRCKPITAQHCLQVVGRSVKIHCQYITLTCNFERLMMVCCKALFLALSKTK